MGNGGANGAGSWAAGLSVAGMAALVSVYVVQQALDLEAPRPVLLAAVGLLTFLIGWLAPAARTTVAGWRHEHRKPPEPPPGPGGSREPPPGGKGP